MIQAFYWALHIKEFPFGHVSEIQALVRNHAQQLQCQQQAQKLYVLHLRV